MLLQLYFNLSYVYSFIKEQSAVEAPGGIIVVEKYITTYIYIQLQYRLLKNVFFKCFAYKSYTELLMLPRLLEIKMCSKHSY